MTVPYKHKNKRYGRPICRVQFMTLCTDRKRPILGSIVHDGEKNVWLPSVWDTAATKALTSLQQYNRTILIEDFVVMPNHIHLLLVYKTYRSNLSDWFAFYCKRYILHAMKRFRFSDMAVWEKNYEASYLHSEVIHSVFQQNIEEHVSRWHYDAYYTPTPANPNTFIEKTKN